MVKRMKLKKLRKIIIINKIRIFIRKIYNKKKINKVKNLDKNYEKNIIGN